MICDIVLIRAAKWPSLLLYRTSYRMDVDTTAVNRPIVRS